ncbi:polysialyltransferase family glycosyltransferase [Vibrio vulnificus]|uniref:polysialyltransferase family glycosyltransferase n=1 Tax=Vibrio vulnificus TaxID=672 RepID=UPI003D7C54C5
MKEVFVIRNLFSLKAAVSIVEQNKLPHTFVSVGLSDENNKTISANIPTQSKFIVFRGLELSSGYFGFIKRLVKLKREVADFIRNEGVRRIYLTNPIHLDTSIFYFAARNLGIEIAFYEEGICFYRLNESLQYKKRTIKGYLKRLLFRIFNISQGYGLKPDLWYASLPFSPKHNKFKLIFNKIEKAKNIENLFLSRPASEDFSGVEIDDEVAAIKLFYEHVVGKDVLFIKFHPRESSVKRKELMEKLRDEEIRVKVLNLDCSSEDILFSMKKGNLAGYETTTLVYADAINKNVKVYSVGNVISKKDKTGTISGFIDFYKRNFNHIEYLN